MYNPHQYPLSTYPASKSFSLAWLLALKQSFAWHVCRVVVALWDVNKPTTQLTSYANDFVNSKSHAREKSGSARRVLSTPSRADLPCRLILTYYFTWHLQSLHYWKPTVLKELTLIWLYFGAHAKPCMQLVSLHNCLLLWFPTFLKNVPNHPHEWFSARSI